MQLNIVGDHDLCPAKPHIDDNVRKWRCKIKEAISSKRLHNIVVLTNKW